MRELRKCRVGYSLLPGRELRFANLQGTGQRFFGDVLPLPRLSDKNADLFLMIHIPHRPWLSKNDFPVTESILPYTQ